MFGEHFVAIVTSFPTMIYTVGFIASLMYWLFVVLGALDMPSADGGDFHFGDAAGGKIALEGLAAKGSAAFVRPERQVRAPLTVYLSVSLTLTWMFSCLGIQALDALAAPQMA